MSKTSPTQRTLQRLKKDGITAQVVEKWNPYGGARKDDGTPIGNRVDLFGIIDIIAVRGAITGIQATSRGNVAHRIAKANDEPRLFEWLDAGGKFEIWGWAKRAKTGRWEVRRVVFDIVMGIGGPVVGWRDAE